MHINTEASSMQSAAGSEQSVSWLMAGSQLLAMAVGNRLLPTTAPVITVTLEDVIDELVGKHIAKHVAEVERALRLTVIRLEGLAQQKWQPGYGTKFIDW